MQQHKNSHPILCTIIKNLVEIHDGPKRNDNLLTKRNQTGKYGQVESALHLWLMNTCEPDIHLDGLLI